MDLARFIRNIPDFPKPGIQFKDISKPGKLPYRTHSLQYDLEYGSAELHVHIDGFSPDARVLVVDDLLATGGTLLAGCQLIEKAGATVAGCAVLLELSFLKGREKLKSYDVFSLVRF
jgi:adenine phosphoribosyltransferase